MKETSQELFDLNGKPSMVQALPLALQHDRRLCHTGDHHIRSGRFVRK